MYPEPGSITQIVRDAVRDGLCPEKIDYITVSRNMIQIIHNSYTCYAEFYDNEVLIYCYYNYGNTRTYCPTINVGYCDPNLIDNVLKCVKGILGLDHK